MVSTLLNNRGLFLFVLASVALAALVAVAVLSSSTDHARANPASGYASVSAGGYHTCAVTTGGGVLCWGWNVDGQLGDGQACGATCPVPVQVSGLTSGVSSVSAGSFHTCARLTTGAVKCWATTTSVSSGMEQQRGARPQSAFPRYRTLRK